MSLKRWQKVFVAAAAAVVPILSCSQRSLVIVTVTAPQGVNGFQGTVNLVIHAGSDEQTRFDGVMFDASQYRAGVYLPSDMTGNVPLRADLEQDNCIIATGNGTATGVQAGETVQATVPLDAVPCQPLDGGAGGTTGTGGALGSGGMMGSGGTTGSGGSTGAGGTMGQGGSTGKGGSGAGGSGSGGVNGTGGTTGNGGTMGNGGTTGKGGVTGTGGIPTTGNGGTTGSGGGTGTGGIKGSGGTVGSGGKGSGGTGSGGLGSGGLGSGGSGTGSGGLGSGGTGGCTCPDPNEICSPASGACVCSQTTAEACTNIVCGTTTNICNQTVTCPDTCPSGEACVSNVCRVIVTTGCGGSVATGGGLVAGSSDPALCPAQ